jgi:23S rRNA (uracil1939-C5)-methyltransferase
LSKLNDAKHHIEFEASLEELGVTSAEAKATYSMIKWVEENYEFGVTNLYIAQIKRKHGIMDHENYNQTGSGKGKVPQCPPEKEKAIEAALKHFQMI